MKKILGIIIFLAVVVGGGYYAFANYIVSEKERVIEAFGNTLNLKEYTSETVVGVNLSGVELTEQEMAMLNSLKLGVRTAVNEEKIEAYLILKATLNYDGYVSEYPLDLQIGTQIAIVNTDENDKPLKEVKMNSIRFVKEAD